MMIYGVAILAGCFLMGQLLGEYLGQLLNIDANVGGVGFAMLFIIIVNQWLEKKRWLTKEIEGGVLFWSNLYIPVIVAMSAIQNVKGALSTGTVALMAGILPTVLCFALVPVLSKFKKEN